MCVCVILNQLCENLSTDRQKYFIFMCGYLEGRGIKSQAIQAQLIWFDSLCLWLFKICIEMRWVINALSSYKGMHISHGVMSTIGEWSVPNNTY